MWKTREIRDLKEIYLKLANDMIEIKEVVQVLKEQTKNNKKELNLNFEQIDNHYKQLEMLRQMLTTTNKLRLENKIEFETDYLKNKKNKHNIGSK